MQIYNNKLSQFLKSFVYRNKAIYEFMLEFYKYNKL